jgi:hypothetical protein
MVFVEHSQNEDFEQLGLDPAVCNICKRISSVYPGLKDALLVAGEEIVNRNDKPKEAIKFLRIVWVSCNMPEEDFDQFTI